MIPSPTPELDRLRGWLDGLPAPARADVARRFAALAHGASLIFLKPDGEVVPIPVLLSPVVVPAGGRARLSEDARLLLAGLERLTAALMDDPARAGLRARLFGAFTPLEAEGLARWQAAAHLATARVDFLIDEGGQPRALEMNATIPAMQGYSDCVAEAFVRAVGEARGLAPGRIEALIGENGRNADDLLASLLGHHRRLGGTRDTGLTIAIVSRAGDAQLAELSHYARRWSALGHDAFLATVEDVALEGGEARVQGRRPDLIYRHVFARRLEPSAPFARICLEPERHRVLNPIASHLEVKGMLGLLCEAADAGQLLDEPERDAVRRVVPWTRVLETGPGHAPDGTRVADLAAFARAEGAHLVLKRSWDYGGKSVFLGAELDDDATQARLRAVMGRGDREGGPRIGWTDLVDFALRDGDAWVLQALVRAPRARHLRVEGGALVPRELYVDLSAYTSAGTPPWPSGGAVRASESRIVNILGGGGMAPLLRAEVLAALLG